MQQLEESKKRVWWWQKFS